MPPILSLRHYNHNQIIHRLPHNFRQPAPLEARP
ncbi:hypothetical protein SAMN05216535_1990 [Stutzerimonas xanthomarina]|uniref:Uncharacterized protein n=2 Tax=Stutzerimonas xanthomarina TaxID=271420 RepID=A0A1M5NVX2_9GAMM|nr:hypothetical protein SAMN05216535_1990 [Stutzerimonas xanthomarina]SHG93329.1 hypothetical protein SAMN02744645_1820 [Stutzerimonas xanthomarina DSM 18231]